MSQKFIVEFLCRWLRDEQFRCAVLHKEVSTLQQEGFTTAQVHTLLQLDKWKIVCMLIEELEELGIDLDLLRAQVHEMPPSPPECAMDDMPQPLVPQWTPDQPLRMYGPGGVPVPTSAGMATPPQFLVTALSMSAGASYGEGQVHLRDTDPESVASGIKRTVTLRAHGFDPADSHEVKFTLDASGPVKEVDGEVKDLTCDIDIYQRLEVKVKLDVPGTWRIIARNTADAQWSDYISITAV